MEQRPELVGLFLLSKLADLNISLGLYRDDRLGVCRMTGRQAVKLLLFDEKIPRTKKGDSHFDGGMGSLDGQSQPALGAVWTCPEELRYLC